MNPEVSFPGRTHSCSSGNFSLVEPGLQIRITHDALLRCLISGVGSEVSPACSHQCRYITADLWPRNHPEVSQIGFELQLFCDFYIFSLSYNEIFMQGLALFTDQWFL